MATKKEIKQILKEMDLTEADMQHCYDELIETNCIIKSLYKSGKDWSDLPEHLIRQLPMQREKDLVALAKQKKEEEESKLKELQKKRDEEYYNEHFEEIMINKIDAGESLSEDELRQLVGEYDIEQEEGGDGRWTRPITSIIELCGRTFAINWSRGLTEYQPNEYDEQPYEVEKNTYTKTITVTEWKRIVKG